MRRVAVRFMAVGCVAVRFMSLTRPLGSMKERKPIFDASRAIQQDPISKQNEEVKKLVLISN